MLYRDEFLRFVASPTLKKTKGKGKSQQTRALQKCVFSEQKGAAGAGRPARTSGDPVRRGVESISPLRDPERARAALRPVDDHCREYENALA